MKLFSTVRSNFWMSLFTKISKITSHFWNYNFEIFLGSFKTALLKYFKRVDAKKPTKIGIVLLKPDSPLSSVMPSSSVNLTVMPSSSIESADVAVENVQTRSHQRMTLENISNAGKCVIIQKYFLKGQCDDGSRLSFVWFHWQWNHNNQ